MEAPGLENHIYIQRRAQFIENRFVAKYVNVKQGYMLQILLITTEPAERC
jgi:hypothetical protein